MSKHCGSVLCIPEGSKAMGEDNYRTFSSWFKWSIQVGWDLKGPWNEQTEAFTELFEAFFKELLYILATYTTHEHAVMLLSHSASHAFLQREH